MAAFDNHDSLLEELDEARRRIFERCDCDPEKVIAFYMELQKQHADRLISRHEDRAEGKSAA